MKRAALGLAALAAALTVGDAAAEEARWNIHLDLGPTFVLDQSLDPGASSDKQFSTAGVAVGGMLEVAPSERWGVEAGFELDELFRKAGGGSIANVFGGLRLRPWFNKEGGWLAGGGGKKIVYISDLLSDFWISAHVGLAEAASPGFRWDVAAGLRLPVVSPLQLGLFVRFSHRIASDDAGGMMLTAGVEGSIGFGSVHAEGDEDHDGVADSKDQCPGTPRGVAVNEMGCEVAPEETTAAPKCPDTDLDGVCDGEDQCPDTPLNTKVDEHGCPPAAAPSDAPQGGEGAPDEAPESQPQQ